MLLITKPSGGMIRSFTIELTILLKELPMMTPIARSSMLPLMANSLNSAMIFLVFIAQVYLYDSAKSARIQSPIHNKSPGCGAFAYQLPYLERRGYLSAAPFAACC